MAIGAYRFSHEKNLRVPEHLSIIGFDDIHLAVYTNPPLTTIRQSKREMGTQAAKLLIQRIAQQDLEPRQEILDTELVIRGSTAVVLQPAGEMNS